MPPTSVRLTRAEVVRDRRLGLHVGAPRARASRRWRVFEADADARVVVLRRVSVVDDDAGRAISAVRVAPLVSRTVTSGRGGVARTLIEVEEVTS